MVLLGMTDNLATFESLVRVETRMWNDLDRELVERHGLSLGRLLALRVLQAAPGSRVHDLARTIDISPGGASKLVDRLVIAGMVDRVTDDSDRRASRLRLTGRGLTVVQEGSATSEQWLQERFAAALGAHGAGPLQPLLAQLLSHVEDRHRDRKDGVA
jgi:DNA-binding MarR family transcriptional regulator